MRTTLTIDRDVAVIIDRVRRQRDANLKDVVNEALRLGLREMTGRPKRRGAFRTRAVALGQLRVGAIDNIGDALAVAEGDVLPVILIDANLLIYAHVSSFVEHQKAREWLDGQLNGPGPVGLPWPSLLAFLRLVTNPRVFDRPEPMADAWNQVNAWLGVDSVWVPQPTPRHAELLGRLLRLPGVHANLVPDAHLAALAMEHGLALCSTDADFGRFPDLRWLNPLKP